MKKFKKVSVLISVVSLVFFVLGFAGSNLAFAATAVNLGTADSFAVLAGSGITNSVGPTTVVGDVGTFPTLTQTGFGTVTITGTNHFGDATTQSAKADLVTAYTNAGQVSTGLISADLGGQILTPGVYKDNGAPNSLSITGTLTLDGQGNADAVFIFQSASTLVTAVNSHVSLINGAQACNVFWQIGSSVTLGTGSDFKGNILAMDSITDNGGSTVSGRFLARNAAVTLNNTAISKAVCTVAPVAITESSNNNTLTVVKHVINDNGGKAKYSDFPLFINNTPVSSGQSVSLEPGLYKITETNRPNYKATFSGDCNASGQVNHGGVDTHNDVCIITNDDIGAPVAVPPVPPLIDVVKVPSPLSLPAGPGAVAYTYTLKNIGTVPVTDITMIGDTCSPIVLASGDTDGDSKLDLKETWVYRCSTTLSATHTNTVVANGWANGLLAVDIASATVVVGKPLDPPLIHVTKIPNPLTLLAGGGMVTYTEKITNPGTVALSNVKLTDDKCSPVKFISGDTNNDSKLDTTETWTYTCRTNLTETTTNTAVAEGQANGLTVRDFALATVVVATAVPSLPDTGFASLTSSGYFLILVGALVLISVMLALFMKKRTI